MHFSVSYDKLTKIVSALVIGLPVVIAFATHMPFIAILGIAIGLAGFAFSPLGYIVADRTIVVRRMIGNVRLPLDGVRAARLASDEDLKGAIRLMGSGGLFGYYGTFRTSKLGVHTWYATNRRRLVVVAGAEKTWVLSPDDADGFLRAVGAPATDGGQAGIVAAGARPYWVLGIAIAVVVLSLIGLVSFYSPGPPSYTFSGRSLEIHDRFYPVTLSLSDVDVARAGVVDIESGDWRPVSRTNGFANANYHAGWFRVANGQKVRMYRAHGKRLVLLPSKGNGAAVLIEVQNPEQFIDEVRRSSLHAFGAQTL